MSRNDPIERPSNSRRVRPMPSRDEPIAVALDIDGTLAATHDVSDYAFSVLSRMAGANVRPFLVTGRSEAGATAICEAAGIESPFVACNGALVMHPVTRETFFKATMDADFIKEVYEFCRGTVMVPTVFTADHIYCEYGWSTALLNRINNTISLDLPWDEIPMGEALKIMIGVPEDLMDEYRPKILERFPMMQQTMATHLETSPKDASKEQAVPIALAHLGIPAHRCIGFGDGENDAGWLQNVGWAVSPANAYPKTKAIADEMIGPNSADSVAHYLEDSFLT